MNVARNWAPRFVCHHIHACSHDISASLPLVVTEAVKALLVIVTLSCVCLFLSLVAFSSISYDCMSLIVIVQWLYELGRIIVWSIFIIVALTTLYRKHG